MSIAKSAIKSLSIDPEPYCRGSDNGFLVEAGWGIERSMSGVVTILTRRACKDVRLSLELRGASTHSWRDPLEGPKSETKTFLRLATILHDSTSPSSTSPPSPSTASPSSPHPASHQTPFHIPPQNFNSELRFYTFPFSFSLPGKNLPPTYDDGSVSVVYSLQAKMHWNVLGVNVGVGRSYKEWDEPVVVVMPREARDAMMKDGERVIRSVTNDENATAGTAPIVGENGEEGEMENVTILPAGSEKFVYAFTVPSTVFAQGGHLSLHLRLSNMPTEDEVKFRPSRVTVGVRCTKRYLTSRGEHSVEKSVVSSVAVLVMDGAREESSAGDDDSPGGGEPGSGASLMTTEWAKDTSLTIPSRAQPTVKSPHLIVEYCVVFSVFVEGDRMVPCTVVEVPIVVVVDSKRDSVLMSVDSSANLSSMIASAQQQQLQAGGRPSGDLRLQTSFSNSSTASPNSPQILSPTTQPSQTSSNLAPPPHTHTNGHQHTPSHGTAASFNIGGGSNSSSTSGSLTNRSHRSANSSSSFSSMNGIPPTVDRLRSSSGGANSTTEALKHFRAIYDYDGTQTDEMKIREGDFVTVVETFEDGWGWGKNTSLNVSGYVFLDYLVPLPPSSGSSDVGARVEALPPPGGRGGGPVPIPLSPGALKGGQAVGAWERQIKEGNGSPTSGLGRSGSGTNLVGMGNGERKGSGHSRNASVGTVGTVSSGAGEGSLVGGGQGGMVGSGGGGAGPLGGAAIGSTYVCILVHQPVRADEILLDMGDIVVLRKIYSDGWCWGTNITRSTSGLFPVSNIIPTRTAAETAAHSPRLRPLQSTPSPIGSPRLGYASPAWNAAMANAPPPMSPVTNLPPPLNDDWVVGKRVSVDFSVKKNGLALPIPGSPKWAAGGMASPQLTTGSPATPNGAYLPPTLDTLAVLDDTLKKLEEFAVSGGDSPVLSATGSTVGRVSDPPSLGGPAKVKSGSGSSILATAGTPPQSFKTPLTRPRAESKVADPLKMNINTNTITNTNTLSSQTSTTSSSSSTSAPSPSVPLPGVTPSTETYVVKYTFMPALPDEMEADKGDIILASEIYEDEWALGRNLTKGVEGVFPLALVERVGR
ncbi:hypothetical protein HDV00_008590 [Rhizophlyctis rosea]|nr:hypothetical protein HDV00_008590 [Rhizophlyctis rosea]